MMQSIRSLSTNGRRLIEYMKYKKYRIQPLNIVYIEDFDANDWIPLSEKLDFFNDIRCVVSDQGDVFLSNWATTEPGRYYTENRLNSKGAFRIAIGQHIDAWRIGDHKGQLALVQVAPVTGFRDNNEDGLRIGDLQDRGIFGINQHTTGINFNSPDRIGRWSAGCLVGQNTNSHYNRFMPLCRQMIITNKTPIFSTTIIDGSDFAKTII